MSKEFARSGFRVRYPDDWKLESEETEDGWCTTLFSPDTAFLMLSYHGNEDDPAAVSDMALESLRESYPGCSVSVTGHTDAIGAETNNMILGQARADAVRDELAAHGVPPEIVLTDPDRSLRKSPTSPAKKIDIPFLAPRHHIVVRGRHGVDGGTATWSETTK